MNENVETTNHKAIKEIENNLDKAFFLFGYNYFENPTLLTIHNYGVFLSKYGREVSCLKSPLKLAKRILKEAIGISDNFASRKELADAYYLEKRYKCSIREYEKALTHKEDPLTYINLTNALYMNGYSGKAANLLEYVVGHFALTNDCFLDTCTKLCFLQATNSQVNQAQQTFELLANRCVASPDILQLAYLCGNYDYILKHYQEVLQGWLFDACTFQTVYQAYAHNKSGDLRLFVDSYRKSVELFYEENPSFDRYERDALLSIIDCGPYIPTIKYLPQFVWQVDFM
uniref:hypothetical protein n=1 Tax=Acetatifactor sp. TaxID=1872090 RepID=UPI004056D4BD